MVGMSDGYMVGSEWCGGVGTGMFRGMALYVIDGELTEGLRNRD